MFLKMNSYLESSTIDFLRKYSSHTMQKLQVLRLNNTLTYHNCTVDSVALITKQEQLRYFPVSALKYKINLTYTFELISCIV